MAALTGDVVANYKKFNIENGTNGRTLVIKLAGSNLTNANLESVINYLTTAHGVSGSGDSAFTVAGLGTADGSAFESGVTDTVYLLAQGTGAVTVGDLDMGIGGLTATVEAIFDQGR